MIYIKLKEFKGNIEFDDVSFGYLEDKVLKDFSVSIKANEKVAIIGESGSGKSTLLNLLTKAYYKDKGKIKLDGLDIDEITEESLRNSVSIVSQMPYIFNMSIRENFELIKPNVTEEELDDICKKACIYDYIMSLEKKYDSVIGEGGINLSGGQRQRLAIARTLLKGSKVMLFDEATSALDNITQKEIQRAIDNIASEHTIIIVAHRLSTIKNCDKIFVLDKGKIVASGNHDELYKDSEVYRRLYESEELVS